MHEEILAGKASLRRALRARAADERAEGWRAMSQDVCARLQERPEWRSARSILAYAPMRDEIDIWPLVREALSAARLVALPRFRPGGGDYEAARIEAEDRDLAIGHFGIREPGPECASLAPNQLDLILVPGVGFDRDGWRLGRGKGHYDRLLSGVRGIRCGVAADWQVVTGLPRLSHDEPVDCIVTPRRWIDCRQRAVWK